MAQRKPSSVAANRQHFEPDLARAERLVMELMAIPGASCEEADVAEFITRRLKQAGATAAMLQCDTVHHRTPTPGQVGNLFLKLPGTKRGPRRLLSAHMDTVPTCVGCAPVRDGDMVRSARPGTALGADDRAGCATTLTTAVEILERGLPHPPLTFCWLVQEEIGLQGARLISKSLLGKPKLAFNWDGGSPTKLTIGATGGYRCDIHVRGIASHAGGAPEWGVSAIAIASLAIADLHRNGWHGDVRKGKKCGTSNVGVIRGGLATNVVTDEVSVRAEARSHDPSFRQRILKEIVRAFESAALEVTNVAGARGSVEIASRLDYESFRIPRSEPCVKAAVAAIRSLNREADFAIANGGLDANWLVAHGVPTVSLGCGQLNPHMTSEALDLAAYRDACRIALRLATTTE